MKVLLHINILILFVACSNYSKQTIDKKLTHYFIEDSVEFENDVITFIQKNKNFTIKYNELIIENTAKQSFIPKPYVKSNINENWILINIEDDLTITNNRKRIKDLKLFVKERVLNPLNILEYPEKKIVNINHVGEFPVSKACFYVRFEISINMDKISSNLRKSKKIVNVILKQFQLLRDELSKFKFNKSYKLLDEAHKKSINYCFPINLEINYNIKKFYPIPPPPPILKNH